MESDAYLDISSADGQLLHQPTHAKDSIAKPLMLWKCLLPARVGGGRIAASSFPRPIPTKGIILLLNRVIVSTNQLRPSTSWRAYRVLFCLTYSTQSPYPAPVFKEEAWINNRGALLVPAWPLNPAVKENCKTYNGTGSGSSYKAVCFGALKCNGETVWSMGK
jgi:hypothetical protein